jgi:hypothetical protein
MGLNMFEEDLDAFFDLDAHGVEVILGNSGDIITGIFDREFLESLDIQGSSPVLTCKSVDVENLTRKDPLEIDGKIYTFVRAEPDGAGVTRVLLELT